LSGGVSTGYQYGSNGSVVGLQGMYDYRIAKRFSIGAQGNLYMIEPEDLQLTLNLRSSFHILKQHRIFPNYWDWYIGVGIGVDLNDDIFPDDIDGDVTRSVEPVFGAHMGLRYKINSKWIVYIEAGNINTSIGLALNL